MLFERAQIGLAIEISFEFAPLGSSTTGSHFGSHFETVETSAEFDERAADDLGSQSHCLFCVAAKNP
jgi:hypothetical protein